MTLEDTQKITDRISEALSTGTEVTWRVQVSEELENGIRMMIIVPVVHSPWGIGMAEERAKKGKEIHASA